MSITILSQVIAYDQSAKAWGLYNASGELVHYHDHPDQAVLAALPEELRLWAHKEMAMHGPAHNARLIRAAALVAEGAIKADKEALGIYSKAYRREEKGMVYAGDYIINVRAATCTCPDFERRRQPCKHLIGATYLFQQYRAEVKRHQASLWNLAQAAIEAHKHEEIERLVIWSGPGGREAYISPMKSFENTLYLFVSGHPHGLCVATRHYTRLPTPTGDVIRWDWSCREEWYKWWIEKLQANS
jgi:hypothetical protein